VKLLVWGLRLWPFLPFLVPVRHFWVVLILMPWFYASWCAIGLVIVAIRKPRDRAAMLLNGTGLAFALFLLAAVFGGAVRM
jgi:hypothetical protein